MVSTTAWLRTRSLSATTAPRIKDLEREVREPKRANEVLLAARSPTGPLAHQLFLALSFLTADAARAFELSGDRTVVVVSSRVSV